VISRKANARPGFRIERPRIVLEVNREFSVFSKIELRKNHCGMQGLEGAGEDRLSSGDAHDQKAADGKQERVGAPECYFEDVGWVIPGQSSVRKGAAGRPALLKRFASPALLAQA